MNKFYITTSIVYTNASPHIGFALELMQADVIARFKRHLGNDVYFLTGTDEHGSKIAKAAKEAKKSPQEFVDELSQKYKNLLLELDISNDGFVRTTDRENHWPGVEKLWEKLNGKGDIYKKKYKGMYCSGCEAFVREKDLQDGKCINHNRKPEKVEEENYFFRLSKYGKEIEKAIKEDKVKIIPEGRKKEVLSFLGEGLEDISVSRSRESLTWGIPIKEDETQTLYVWMDALTNYISALGYGRDDTHFRKYWPADVHCIGKDILRFHACIWIGMLLSADLELPKNIFVHGYITSDGKKMSKSLGNVVDPFSLIKDYGSDAVRYFFLREMPSSGDGDFSEKRFRERYNSDLADGIGNLTARVVTMAMKKNCLKRKKKELSFLEEKRKEMYSLIEEFKFNEALSGIWSVIHFADRHIEEKKPWEDLPENVKVVEELICILYFLSETLSFFIPKTAKEIENQLKTGEKNVLFPKK